MAEENLQKNRVVYNVQDLFFGLVSGEQNTPYVTGYNGESVEVLKRIHKVQSVSYDFRVERQDVGVLGRSSYEDNLVTAPPNINVTVSHLLEGLNNERKMGFNVLGFNSSTLDSKEFTSTFLAGNKQQNIYLAVNQDQSDIRETQRHPSEIHTLIASGLYEGIAHTNTDKMGLIVFQNCRVSNYGLDISLNTFPKVDVSFISDNAIYLNSASGQYVPWINTETAKSYYKQNNLDDTYTEEQRRQAFIVPGNFARENIHFNPNHTFKPGDAQITIETRAAAEDVLYDYDYENGVQPHNTYKGLLTNDNTNSYAGLRSLKVDGDASGGGFWADGMINLEKDEYYTLDARIKTDSINSIIIRFDVQDVAGGSTNNLSTFQAIKYQDGWIRVKKRVKIDAVKKRLYVYTNTADKNFWVDSLSITKDSKNPPIKFHSDLLQSFKLNVPLTREAIACVGHKYYYDRPIQLPVKTTFSLDMSSQDKEYPISVEGEDRQGNFLDNLTKDQDYDVSLVFTDDQANEGMRFKIFGAKFEGVSYGLDIGSPKSNTVNFSMSNDYDYGRSIIAAEGKGLFVLNFLVNDSLINLTDDNGDYLVDSYLHNF